MTINEPAVRTRLDSGHRHDGWALALICLAQLMVVLDATIANIALPFIKEDLGISQANLSWVVTGYALSFGGLLLLGGRLGDLYGYRKLFLIGLSLFTLASLACGVASSQEFLVGARAIQGFGGAIVAVIALSLVMTLFTEPGERAKAMGVIGFVASGGGTVGEANDAPGTSAFDLATLIRQSEPLAAPAPTRADDPAFWLYSSGSTGKPKGTVHTHANA